jgi:hypothetical protein
LRRPVMAGQIHAMSKTLRKIWSVVSGSAQPDDAPAVVVHDPAGQQAHNLDDPFFDDGVQGRIGDLIASTGNRKTKNSY